MQDKIEEFSSGSPISQRQAAGSVASPLSFSRAGISALFSSPCRFEKLRLELDDRGRGEARATGGKR